MSQSKGPDHGAGAGAPPRARIDGYDPRDPRQHAAAAQQGQTQQPYAQPAYPQVPGSAAPYGGQHNSGGYGYPAAQPPAQASAAHPPAAHPMMSARQPEPLSPPAVAQPPPHSAYQYLPQGYGQPTRQQPPAAPPRPAPRQEPQFDYDAHRQGRQEPVFEAEPDPRGFPRPLPMSHTAQVPGPGHLQPPPMLQPAQRPAIQPLSQLPGYPRAPAAPSQPAQSQPGQSQPGQSQPGQSPRFDPRYIQQALAPQPPPQPYRQPQSQPPYRGEATHAPPAPAMAPPDLRGGHFDHHASDDPRGYGLPSQFPPRAGSQQPGQTGYGQGQPQGYIPPQPTGPPQAWDDRHGDPSADASAEEVDEEFEEEPPRSGGRRVLMVGLLVGAIATGGGLAYAYKSYFAAPGSGQPKIVKAPTDPARVAPANPGGKKVANGDSKLLDRLPSDGQRAEDGQIKIVTIPVNRNGQLTAPAVQPVEPRAPSSIAPTAGIILRDSGPPGLPQFPPGATPPAQPQSPPQPPPQRGVTITNSGAAVATAPAPAIVVPAPQPTAPVQTAPPPKRVAVAPAPPPAAEPEDAVKAAAAKKAKAREPDAYSPAGQPAAAGAAAPATTSAQRTVAVAKAPAAKVAGYVSALSSHDTKEAALRSLADLQQTYSAALTGKLLDVAPTDAATKARGFNYRVVAGPPGSKQSASTICGQLKAAGHSTCWAVPYAAE